jgi:translation initiation factor IF-3
LNTTLIKNEKIQSRFIKLVDEEKMIGIVSLSDALARARSKGLDLVLITEASENEHPVCKILDADRWRYDVAKQQKMAAKRQRNLTVETKEIQLRPVTDQNDIGIKAKTAKRFLDDGDKVRVLVKFKGREKTHKSMGHEVMLKFLTSLGEHKIEKELTDTGNDLSIVLAPLVTKSELHKQKSESNS